MELAHDCCSSIILQSFCYNLSSCTEFSILALQHLQSQTCYILASLNLPLFINMFLSMALPAIRALLQFRHHSMMYSWLPGIFISFIGCFLYTQMIMSLVCLNQFIVFTLPNPLAINLSSEWFFYWAYDK